MWELAVGTGQAGNPATLPLSRVALNPGGGVPQRGQWALALGSGNPICDKVKILARWVLVLGLLEP
ncbi:hypothetical protein E4U37_004485 [Claviceps purpurea]|nr:hypothetical protein E4U37_004485 [Claviceps purpurea]